MSENKDERIKTGQHLQFYPSGVSERPEEGRYRTDHTPVNRRKSASEMKRISTIWSARLGRETSSLWSPGPFEKPACSEDVLRRAQKMEIVGQSVAGIAHDFNNMMTCVIGALDLLQILLKREQSDDIDTLLGDATVAANRAQALASRLLDFSHPTSNDPHPIDVNSVVRSMETLLRSALGIGIQCDLRLSDGLLPIFCDTHEFENALFNLVINARDAISAGGIVRIETCATILDDRDGALESREYVNISVTDNGAGMSPELIQRAFEPFFTTKASDKGTGLGLPLVRSFVERFDGHLDVESAVNQGTSIRMYFPPIHGAPCSFDP